MDRGPVYNLKAFYVCPNTYSANNPPYVPIVVRRKHSPVGCERDGLLSRFFDTRELLAPALLVALNYYCRDLR